MGRGVLREMVMMLGCVGFVSLLINHFDLAGLPFGLVLADQ